MRNTARFSFFARLENFRKEQREYRRRAMQYEVDCAHRLHDFYLKKENEYKKHKMVKMMLWAKRKRLWFASEIKWAKKKLQELI